ncbi:unnamed protein product [Blepharisma stoltei]|uniref:Uncharacterized protein n=1 Tax=Blepharisma stoltei TaxID=1481888 RepID=A0AAU9J9T4_9CILI|nr:unnamed protein product [Blepharisma stoltei]
MSKLRIEVDSYSGPKLSHSNLKINTSYSPTQQEIFYFPSGSLSSHKNSVTYTEDDLESNTDTRQEQSHNEEEASQDLNFITYLPQTPENEYKGLIFEAENMTKWDQNSINQTDCMMPAKIINAMSTENCLIIDIKPLQNTKLIKEENEALKQSLDLYKFECERYAKENSQLICEIQQNSKDLQDLLQAEKKIKYEMSGVLERKKVMEDEMIKILELVEDASEDEGVTQRSKMARPGVHLFNHICSKLEIIRSRMHRYRAKTEKLQHDINFLNSTIKNLEEKQKNSDENSNLGIKLDLIEKKNALQDDQIESLKKSIKNKDIYISQLETQIKHLKLESEKNCSSRLSLATDGSLNGYSGKQAFEEETRKLGKRANSVAPESEESLHTEHFNYNDVLKDLREITSRASRALDQSNVMRKSNSVKASHAHSASPFLKSKEPSQAKPLARKPTEELSKKSSISSKQLDYERLKRKYGGISPFSPRQMISKGKYDV